MPDIERPASRVEAAARTLYEQQYVNRDPSLRSPEQAWELQPEWLRRRARNVAAAVLAAVDQCPVSEVTSYD